MWLNMQGFIIWISHSLKDRTRSGTQGITHLSTKPEEYIYIYFHKASFMFIIDLYIYIYISYHSVKYQHLPTGCMISGVIFLKRRVETVRLPALRSAWTVIQAATATSHGVPAWPAPLAVAGQMVFFFVFFFSWGLQMCDDMGVYM